MKYNLLGKSDLSVSEIGFGCMSLQPGDPSNQSAIDMAIDNGINFFDTADLYNKGENEKELSKLLGSRRKNLVIATKVGNQWREDGSGWDWNPRKDYIISAVEKSLQRLNTDYLDLYQLHGGTIEDNITETIEAFDQLVTQGKIRYYGISSIRPEVISEYLKYSDICCVMMQYSLLDRKPEAQAMGWLRDHNVSLLARGSLAKGLLAGKPAKEYQDISAEEVAAIANSLKTSANASQISGALDFVLQNPVVASAVVGIRTVDQCREVIAGRP